jgi:tetratricopeptide (TPR) repeat protein
VSPGRPRRDGWIALALFGAAFALYARAGAFDFVEYDDPGYVRDNVHIAHGLDGASFRWAWTSAGYQYNWHPLTWLSHALDVELFGLEAGPHHLVNAALHGLGSAFLYLALAALTGARLASACAAALCAFHPLRVESVAWIAERKDVLAALFFALALWAYARHARAPGPGRLALVALALAAGLAAKPTLVTAPLLFLALDAWPLGRIRRGAPFPWAVVREKLPLLALSLASALVTLHAQRAGGALKTAPLAARLVNAVIAYAATLADAAWPTGLACFYPHPGLVAPERSRLLSFSAALALCAALTVLAWRTRRSRPWIALGWGWFLVALLPMIGLVQVGSQARADRYATLALVGPALALAWSIRALACARARLHPWLALLAAVWLALLAALSFRQLGFWRDSETLFTRALAVTERNFAAHNNLGVARARAGDLDGALAQFEAAAEAWPDFHEAWLNAGIARYRRAELEPARAALERALDLWPASREGRVHLVATLARLGEFARAGAELELGSRLDPGFDTDPRVQELGRRLAARREGG